MGQFIYGSPAVSVDFDDRVLAHLKIVILSKVRRNESFAFSWEYSVAAGSGQTTVWIHPALPLQFTVLSGLDPRLNRAWVDELARLANSPAGLRVVAEPPE